MVKDEILEILALFDKYKISDERQRELFESGIYFDFTYGDPDPMHRNQHLNIFGIGMLLKTCRECHIRININKLIDEPYNFPYEELVKEIAVAQKSSYVKVRRLGGKR